MPALILIVPLIAAYWDQAPRKPVVIPTPPAVVRPVRSFTLPPNTEVIYFITTDCPECI